jgi:hypothetical protein
LASSSSFYLIPLLLVFSCTTPQDKSSAFRSSSYTGTCFFFVLCFFTFSFHTHTRTNTKKHIVIMLEVNCKTVLFDEVAVNDIPTYRPVRVQNKSDASLSVTITASSSLLRFQLCNENYEAIQQVGIRDSLCVYNETFDLVGLISSLDLAPREEKEITVSFRAEPAAFSHLAAGAQASPLTGTLQFTATASQSVNAASSMSSGENSPEGSCETPQMDENKNVVKAAAQVVSPPTLGSAAQQQQHTEQLTVPFRANVYVSLLKLSLSEIQVSMAPNKTQVTDFVITNTSCQPALFLIRDQPMPLKGLDVALYEADKFEDPKLGHRILLDSYASMTFSLMLRSSGANPNTQQQYRTVLQCENLRDSRNTTLIYISVSVGTESQGDVVAFPDTSVDFGDVYRGTKAYAKIRVQNIDGREDAIVRLGDMDRRKYDGKFSFMKGDAVVDELTIAAQKGNPFTTVTLMYQPSYNIDSKEAAKKKFDVELIAQSANRTNSQRVVVRCSAMLYTSSIVVSQRSVNFGDCQVGQSKRYTLQIENQSPLQGKIVVQLRSKIIQIEGISHAIKHAGRELREEFTIAPSASLPLTLKITPQRVNPMYRKQLTIINASNPAEDRQVINIEANNMAPLDAKLHDELYSWKCDLGGNSDNNNGSSTDAVGAHRGSSTLLAISNVPLLVPYSVQSKVNREVILNLRSSSPEIEVFYCTDLSICDKLGEISAELRRHCLYGEGEDSSYLTNESAEQLFKAREELLKLLSETSRNITNRIILEPNTSLKAYALIIRTACPTEPLTKEDGISIAVDGIEAPRFVRLSYRLCGTTFELSGQKTKNFGEVNIGVKKTTKLPIVNRCNSFLFLHLSKSRSVTAEHLRMEHSEKQSIFLTIRPYASREIELTLYPGIKGLFQEKIRVTNILNIQNSITVTIKAVVTKADTFEISPDSWTFEMMVPPSASAPTLMASSSAPSPIANSSSAEDSTTGGGGSASAGAASNARVGAKFTLANTSNSRRQIIARVELSNTSAATSVTASHPYLAFPGVKVAVQLDMTLTGASSISTRKLEEQIEKLEQKLKIYIRKKKTEKADNARRKIEAYRLALKGEEVDLTALESAQSSAQGTTDHELSESEDESSSNALQALKSKTQQSDIAQLLRREGVALPSMGAGESVMITLFLVCKRVMEEPIPVTQSQTMNLLFYEARDQEANRIIPIDMILMRTPGDTLPHQLPAALGTTAAAATQSLTSVPFGVKAGEAQEQQKGDSPLTDAATNPLTAPSPKATPGVVPPSSIVAAQPPRGQPQARPPSIRLTTTGAVANSGGGRLHSTFMGHPLLVLRNCIVNDQTEFSFLVEADGDTTIVVLEPRRCGGSVPEVLDARFKLFPRNGHVRQQEPLRIVVECTARSVGPQKYFIPVKNIRNASDVHYLTVEMNPTEEIDMLTTEPKELFFRDVLTPCAPSQLEAQVVLIRSRFPFLHALVVRTNKPSQLALFEDASCTIPLIHPIRRIFVKETVRVYVQLRPGARYIDPRARNIHAGVLVEALAPNPAVSSTAFCVVGKAVLRAVACVGSGIVEVLQRTLELGCVPSTQHYAKTQFTLRNTSYSFSLRIGLVASSPLVEVTEETAHREITLAPLEERVVLLVLHLPAPGLAQEFIDVTNRSSAQETVRVSLSALRLNDGIMQVEPALNTPLTFPLAAVVRGEKGEELRLHQPVSCSVKMANYHSNREVILATTAITPAARELPLWFHTSDEEAQVRTALAEEQQQALKSNGDDHPAATGTNTPATAGSATGQRSGTTAPTTSPTPGHLPPSTYVKGRVELQANRAQVVMWTLTDLPALTAEEVATVLQHQLVTISSTMQVCVTYTTHSAKAAAAAPRSHNGRSRGPAVGQCVLLVPVTLSLSMSEGRAEPAVVNLGLVAKPTSPPASPTSAPVEMSSDDDDSAEADDGAASPASTTTSNNNEEAVLAARVRRRRRVRLAQLRRPGTHRQFSCYSAKSGLQQSSGHNMVVSFRLVNLSPVMPLPLKVECPPVIRFSQTRLTLPPGASMSVEATLNLKLITTQGNFRYEAFFVNEWNPENDMAVSITGQHYWKVLKILRTDTEEEVRDAVMLSPLRVEPSLLAPLSELKLAFVATEPDVEFDLHVQPNPQLGGLLELLLLHYDATSAAQHLSFRSDVSAVPTGAAPSAAAGSNGAPASNTAAAAAAGGAAAVMTGGGAAAGDVIPVRAVPPAVTGGGGGALPYGETGAALTPGDDAITTTAAAGNTGQPLTAQGTPSGGNGGGTALTGMTSPAAAAGVAPTTTTSPAPSVKPRKAGAGTSGGANGGNAMNTAVTTRSQRLRLRCMLRSGDLASLVSIFYGFRRSRTNVAASSVGSVPSGSDASSPGGAAVVASFDTTVTSGGGGSASSVWTYDRIAEVERRSAALLSNNVWLGTVWVANPFTEDEEVQVYGTLTPFRTFTAPSKVALRPSRINVEPPKWLTHSDANSNNNSISSGSRAPQVGYVGEIAITNDFDVYVADIAIVVLVNARLGVPLEIDVRGGQRSAGGISGTADVARGDTTGAEAGSGAVTASSANTLPSDSAPAAPASYVATSFIAVGTTMGGAAPPVSQAHCVQLSPHETVVLTVAVRPAGAGAVSGAATTATTTPPLSLTSLEQFVSVLIVDDNVPFSYHVCRVNVVTPADGVEMLPIVTLSGAGSQSQPPSALSNTNGLTATRAVAAAAAASAKEDDRGGRSPTPPSTEPAEDATYAAQAAGDGSPEPPLSRASRHSSTPTSHCAADDEHASLSVPPAAAEPTAAETTSPETTEAVCEAAGGVSGDVRGAPLRVGGSEGGAAEGASSATATRCVTPAASATTATGVVPPIAPDAAGPRQWVLSLRNCDPLPGCGGAYISNFSVARDDTYDANILITNNLPNTAVRYSVQVISQSPQVWLLLTSTSGLLEGGETQPLRLQVLSSDVGSFVGYVAVTNTHDTREVVYLRINAEVFVSGTAEGLFDVIAMNGGHRLATSSAVHSVDMGALYGAGSTRTLIALEIVNKGNVALEFPVSVVHPMRQELRPIPQSSWYGSAVATPSRLRRHANGATAAAAATTPHQYFTSHTEGAANTPNSLSVSSSALPSATPAAAVESSLLLHDKTRHPVSLFHHHPHHSSHHRRGLPRMSSAGTASTSPASATAMNGASASPFEGRLVVSHLHNVAARTGQKYFVADPRSPLRLAFLLSCTALHDIPEGYGVFGEADVVFKCRQARDAQFTFHVTFEAFKPTFAVALEYDMDAAENAAAAAAVVSSASHNDAGELTHPGTPSPAGVSLTSLPPPAVALPATARSGRAAAASSAVPAVTAASSRWATTEVAVTNLSRTQTQVFALFTQSEVLTLAPSSGGGAAAEQSALPGVQLLPPTLGTVSGDDISSGAAPPGVVPSSPAVEVTVPPQGVGVFVVRLDRLRAEALLNFDKDELKLARPALCEHAFLYNKGNPRERVQLLFRQQAVSAQSQRQSRVDVTSIMSAKPLSPTRTDAKPVKGNSTQHFSERHILGFAQRFSAVLTSLAGRLLFVTRGDDVPDGGCSSNGNSGGGSGGSGGGGAVGEGGAKGGSMGDYAGAGGKTTVVGSLRASAANAALSGANTPGRPHHHHITRVHGSRLNSSSSSDEDDSTTSSDDDSTATMIATTTTTTSSRSTSGGSRSRSASGDETDQALNSTLTDDSNALLSRTIRDVADESGSRDLDVEGLMSRGSGLVTGRVTRSSSEGLEGDRRTRQQTPSAMASPARMRSVESSADAFTISPNSPPALSAAGMGGTRSSIIHRSSEGAWRYEALMMLHDLLVELTWLCDELLFYAILLRNSRHVEACGAFLVAAVSQHPVMVAWRRRRGNSSSSSGRTRECDIFSRYLDTINVLPRLSNSTV